MFFVIKTPIWTGDIDTESNILQATGIMGSIRWWTEAILRGIGKFACNPVEDNPESSIRRCPTTKENNQEISYYCPTCFIFGATGIRRAFKLGINGGEKLFNGGPIRHIKPWRRNRGWFLGSGLKGEITLDITPLDKDFEESLVLVPLAIATKWGAVGAKTQLGYGVIDLIELPEIKITAFKETIANFIKARSAKFPQSSAKERVEDNTSLPNIKEMFFAKVRFEVNNDWWKGVDGIRQRKQNGYVGYANDERMKNWANSGSIPIVPALKNWLRYREEGRQLWQTDDRYTNNKIENWLFGTTQRTCSYCFDRVKPDEKRRNRFFCFLCKSLHENEINERLASKINISCAYVVKNHTWEFRIWGWVPKKGISTKQGKALGFNRENFLNQLKASLDGSGSVKLPWDLFSSTGTTEHKFKLIVWREYDSPRDTVTRNENNPTKYLQSLLDYKEGLQ